MRKVILSTLIIILITLLLPERDAQSSGRWVVCFRVELLRGPYGVNQTCIRCALADSGGYSYVYPGSSGNVCAGSRESNWKTFSKRADAVSWIDTNCGCRSSADLPAPQ